MRRVRVVERVGDRLVDPPPPERAEEPHPVPHQRPAQPEVQIEDLRHRVRRAQSLRRQVGSEVVALPRARRVRPERRPVQRVAAVLGDHVQANSRGLHLRAERAGLVTHLLEHALVEVVLDGAVAFDAVDAHPVHLDGVVATVGAVHGHVGLLHPGSAADIRRAEHHAVQRRADAPDVSPGRHGFEQLVAEHLLLDRALDVDDRRLAGDGDALFERANPHLDVDGGGEVGGELDALAAHGVEAGERESHHVHARPQIDDPVLPAPVSCRGSGLLDQGGAADFDQDAGHERTACIADRSGDDALCGGRTRQEDNHRRECGCSTEPHGPIPHTRPPSDSKLREPTVRMRPAPTTRMNETRMKTANETEGGQPARRCYARP